MTNRTIVEYALASLVVSLAWKAYNSQSLSSFLSLGVYILCAFLIFYGGYLFRKRKAAPAAREDPSVQARLRNFLFACNLSILVSLVAYAEIVSYPKIQYSYAEYGFSLFLSVSVSVAAWGVFLLGRQRPFRNSIQVIAAILSLVLVLELWRVYSEPDPSETLRLGPIFQEPFYTLNGGSSRLINTSLGRTPTRHLYAFLVSDHKHGGTGEGTPQDRMGLSFGKPILSPSSGVIYEVIQDLPDHAGTIPYNHPLGNFIKLQIDRDDPEDQEERYVLLTNLKQGSVAVAVGDRVEAGQVLAEVGWSGIVSECMLILLVADTPYIFSADAKSFPFYFQDVRKQGDSAPRELYFPRRNDLFIPLR